MNDLKINYRQIPTRNKYYIRQENCVTEDNGVLFQNVHYQDLFMEIVRISSSGAANINFEMGEIEVEEEKNYLPVSIRHYVAHTNQLLKKILLSVDSRNHIESVENQNEIVKLWDIMKKDIF
jgi:hypothetical protein